MYDINTKNVKKGISFNLVFLIAGLAFFALLVGFYVSNHLKLKSMDSEVLSSRVEVNTHRNNDGDLMYSPIYYYIVDGNSYMCSSNSSTSNNPGTTNRKVYYNSKDPSVCMTEYSNSNNAFLLIFTILPLMFIVVAIININKVIKRIKLINELNKKGKLVKNLRYHLENTNMAENGIPIQRPVVNYILPSGATVVLYGDPRHDKKTADEDGMVDLVIDENNPENYFIDFEINRISGNLPTDYYTPNEDSSQGSQF